MKSSDAILMTGCDKLHNATAILSDLRNDGLSVFDRFTAGREDTLWYYGELARALSTRAPTAQAKRLAETVESLRSETGRLMTGG
ncbi:hypothetical protein [Thetidibacter halocola]|uniref:Uncharacterized protein n=1 Tax=Thetidibacter halocola TaxID=2827239 RepID=A0A8J8B821_9RHOB|nr:hypothetical protein [Thetidibacter halocola]MBS0124309.1 hypothetical protein [Thetidibacter halocola]